MPAPCCHTTTTQVGAWSNSSCLGCGKYGHWAASGEIDILEAANDMRTVRFNIICCAAVLCASVGACVWVAGCKPCFGGLRRRMPHLLLLLVVRLLYTCCACADGPLLVIHPFRRVHVSLPLKGAWHSQLPG